MSDRQPLVVVVEDDPDIRELIRVTLTLKGMTVHTATNGRDGMDLVATLHPDLVTLDIGLPDLDGIEVCRRIRAGSDAYIVLISARHDEVDRLMGLETGADDYITKPFSPREVSARVAAMFRRPRASTTALGPGPTTATASADPFPGAAANATAVGGGPASSGAAAASAAVPQGEDVVSLGRLVVDPESRVVTVDAAEVELTRTEFDLLATMIAAPRRVWGRDVLLRLVWGEGWSGDEHLVEVHVGNMRRKLARASQGSGAFIRTVRGVGYRMEEPTAV